MTNDRAVAELEQFLAERADRLLRTAVLLTGSREAGQDLLQTALERLLRHWRTLSGDPEGYLRRTLYNLAADGFRRQGRLQRKLLLLRADTRPPPDVTAQVDLRDALVRMLVQLPPRQRAVLVLRYWEQLSEAETAAVLGWPEGTVKSAASRGLRRLRELADGLAAHRTSRNETGLRSNGHEDRRGGTAPRRHGAVHRGRAGARRAGRRGRPAAPAAGGDPGLGGLRRRGRGRARRPRSRRSACGRRQRARPPGRPGPRPGRSPMWSAG